MIFVFGLEAFFGRVSRAQPSVNLFLNPKRWLLLTVATIKPVSQYFYLVFGPWENVLFRKSMSSSAFSSTVFLYNAFANPNGA